MKFHRALMIAAALTPIVSIATPAFAGEKSSSLFVSGVVVKVDRDARTLVVREDGSDRTTTIYVPENRRVALSRIGNSTDATIIAFEHARRGLRVKMQAEPASGTIALTQAK